MIMIYGWNRIYPTLTKMGRSKPGRHMSRDLSVVVKNRFVFGGMDLKLSKKDERGKIYIANRCLGVVEGGHGDIGIRKSILLWFSIQEPNQNHGRRINHQCNQTSVVTLFLIPRCVVISFMVGQVATQQNILVSTGLYILHCTYGAQVHVHEQNFDVLLLPHGSDATIRP